MKISCCAWGLDTARGLAEKLWRKAIPCSDGQVSALRKLAAIGVDAFDLSPSLANSEAIRTEIAKLGLPVTCVGLSHDAPQGCSLEGESDEQARAMEQHAAKALEQAAQLEVRHAYLVPEALSAKGKLRHESHQRLAEKASALGIKLCVEHFPGRALPRIQDALRFVAEVDHPNLYLLVDIGHAQIAGEDLEAELAKAGDRFAYLHLNDNDGVSDLHQALTDGLQTEETFAKLAQTLERIAYKGPVSLEINPRLPQPFAKIESSLKIARQHFV